MHSLWKLTIKSLNFLHLFLWAKKFVKLKWDLQTINFHDCFRYFCHQCFWRENCHWFEFSRQISKIHSIFWAIFKDCVFCCYVNASIFHAYFFIAFETEMGCRQNFEILGILSCFFFPNVFLECIKPRYFSYFIFMSACQNTLCFFSFSWKCFLKTQVSTFTDNDLNWWGKCTKTRLKYLHQVLILRPPKTSIWMRIHSMIVFHGM